MKSNFLAKFFLPPGEEQPQGWKSHKEPTNSELLCAAANARIPARGDVLSSKLAFLLFVATVWEIAACFVELTAKCGSSNLMKESRKIVLTFCFEK